MKKLPSFTLMELLIGMIISSIVISFGYLAYTLFYKQYLSYKHVKEKIMETTQLYHVLSDDMRQAEIVSFNENTLIFHQKNTPELKYVFYDSLITRTNLEVTDTFNIITAHIKNASVFSDNPFFIKQLSFEVTTLNEKEYFNIVKDYSSETLMKYKALTKTSP